MTDIRVTPDMLRTYPRGRANPWTGRRVTTPEDPHCTADRHNPTDNTWRHGCRCPGAIRAHEEWNAARQARRAALRQLRTDTEDGSCGAVVHDTREAYRVGCRCEEAVRRYLAVQEAWALRRRERTAVRKESARRAVRRWRGPDMVVDRLTLDAAVHGYPMPLTLGELIAADAVLQLRRMPEGGRRWRAVTTLEIAHVLKVDDRSLYRARQRRRERAEHRTARRLADARLRAEVTAAGVGAKQRRRAGHEAAAAAAAERRLAWKQHCRTMRRLRESQQRAKVVALAIERRRG